MKKKYWYKIYIEECVVCGKQDKYKERQYSEKPKDPQKIINFTQNICYNCKAQ